MVLYSDFKPEAERMIKNGDFTFENIDKKLIEAENELSKMGGMNVPNYDWVEIDEPTIEKLDRMALSQSGGFDGRTGNYINKGQYSVLKEKLLKEERVAIGRKKRKEANNRYQIAHTAKELLSKRPDNPSKLSKVDEYKANEEQIAFIKNERSRIASIKDPEERRKAYSRYIDTFGV